jgi:hypothetical protein
MAKKSGQELFDIPITHKDRETGTVFDCEMEPVESFVSEALKNSCGFASN